MSGRIIPERRVIGLYVDVTRDYACAKALEIATLARHEGFSVVVHPSQAEALGFDGDAVELADASLLITVGGGRHGFTSRSLGRSAPRTAVRY